MQDIKAQLEKCNTAAEMLKIVVDAFHLDAPLSIGTKAFFIAGLVQAVKMIKAPRKF